MNFKKKIPECPTPTINLLNGSIHFVTQQRTGYFLNGDVIKYTCDDGYELLSGNDNDYFYACQDGSLNNTRVPLCIKGKNFKVYMF